MVFPIVSFCGFWCIRILLYFPLFSVLCHRLDISTVLDNLMIKTMKTMHLLKGYQGWTGKFFFTGRGVEGVLICWTGWGGAGNPPLPGGWCGAGMGFKSVGRGGGRAGVS